MSGDEAELLILQAELILSGIPLHLDAADGSSQMSISGIMPGDLHRTLSLVERRVTDARLLPGQKRVVSRVDDRLCAWEHELAVEGAAKRSFCSQCRGRELLQVSMIKEGQDSLIEVWCTVCWI